MTYGEAATHTVKGLSSQPALLLIAVINIIMLLALLYVARVQADERREISLRQDNIVKLLLEKCGPGERP